MKISKTLRNGVVGIGNFDGVHKGHRAVLDTVRSLTATAPARIPCAALSFEPHPRTVFKPDTPVVRITPEAIKARLCQAIGLSGLISLPFTKDFATMSADAFVKDLLVKKLAATHVVVGYNFHFGKGREGSPEFLMDAGRKHGFAVTIIPPMRQKNVGEIKESVVSSSAIREALASGDVSAANEMLGYSYFVNAEIIHGEKRGRELGYPTANMELPTPCPLRHGIYAVEVRFAGGETKSGVANYGRRPHFDNGKPLLETFVFDFKGDLYGQSIDIVFKGYLRGEEKFDNLDALIVQMDKDSINAKAALAISPPPTAIDNALRSLF